MPKSRDKKGKKESGRKGGGGGGDGGMAALFGMPPDLNVSEADLEAELLALQGKSPRGGRGGRASGQMSMGELDSMMAKAQDLGEEGSGEEGEDDEEFDEEELMGELEELTESISEEPSHTKPVVSPRPPIGRTAPPPSTSSGDHPVIQERLTMYQTAVTKAKEKGEASKVRRYERAITSINSMAKQARAGKQVNIEDLPPVIAGGGASVPPSSTGPVGGGGGGGGGGRGGGGRREEIEISDEDLAAWAGSHDREAGTKPPSRSPKPQPVARTSGGGGGGGRGGGEETMVADRLALYQQAVRDAEREGESSKARHYKRSLGVLEKMLKDVKAGRAVSMEDLPPVVSVKSSTPATSEQHPPPPKPKPRPSPPKPPPTKQGNLIDLDAPEFDEFNLTDEDFAALASTIVDDRGSHTPPAAVSQPQPPKPKPRPSPGTSPRTGAVALPGMASGQRQQSSAPGNRTGQSSLPPPPQPVPRAPRPSHPSPSPSSSSSTRPPGLIDLDAPEFDEFNLSEEDLAALAATMTDDRSKKQKMSGEDSLPMDTSPVRLSHSGSKIAPPPPKSTQSLPPKLGEPPSSDQQTLKAVLAERKEQFTAAMKQCKQRGDTSRQKEYGLMAVQFGRVIKAIDQGQPIDLSQMPGPPPGYLSRYNIDLSKFSTPAPTTSLSQHAVERETPAQAVALPPQPEGDEIDPQIPTPRSALEALEQRLAKYRETQRLAQEKGESSRVRRMGRIIKQYETAIKDTKAKKPCDYSELPTPPGYPPIPVQHTPRPVRTAPVAAPKPTQSLPVQAGAKPLLTPSISQKQLSLLQQRKNQLHNAAKRAKASGDKSLALHYLKQFKAVESMIESAENGLPVDLTQVPPPPSAEGSRAQPSGAVLSHLEPAQEGDDQTFDLIESQLQKQVDICDKNADIYEKIGNIGSSSQYKNMSHSCQKELLAIKAIRSQGLGPPKFTIEMRKFTIIHSHAHLSSQQCEVEISRVLNMPKPSGYEEKDLCVYVEIEFPWPTDSPQKATTSSVKDTTEPEFNSQNVFDIDRKHTRSMLRVFKRSPVKCAVWQRRTLRKDLFIGQGLLSLEGLETKSECRSCVDMVDEKGRKPSGGKMEAVVRLREPLSGRDQEEKEEQWLVFKEAIAAKSSVSMPKPGPSPQVGGSTSLAALSPVKMENTISMEALKFELSLVQSAIKAGHKDSATVQRGRQIQARLQTIRQRLQSDAQFRQGYPKQITREMQQEQALEQQLARAGKQTQVKILQGRRAKMESELKSLQGRS